MDGLEIARGLIARGYPPHQAAALAGHMLQESGGNPAAVNPSEGANGLMQWRLDRWDALKDYAKAQGKPATDPNVQLDFVSHELGGAEKKAGSAFLSSPDLDTASGALKQYIRFGDDSAGTRLANGRGLFAQLNGGPVGALSASAGVAPGPVAAAPAPDAGGQVMAPGSATATMAPVGALAGGAMNPQAMMQAGAKMVAGPEFDPVPQLQLPTQNKVGQSQQIAAALAKAYGFGG